MACGPLTGAHLCLTVSEISATLTCPANPEAGLKAGAGYFNSAAQLMLQLKTGFNSGNTIGTE
jgi:hypothetical protein